MTIKLIALDLDGTTLNSRGKLSDENRETLEKAIESGVHVVVATGRAFTALPEDIFKVKGIEYTITSNGAEVRKLSEGGKVIYSNYIKAEAVEKIVELLKNYDYMVEIFVGGKAYIDRYFYENVNDVNMPYRNIEYVLETRNPLDDLYGFALENKDRVENVNINFAVPADKENMKPKFEALDNVTLTSSFSFNWELGGETTSKASALEALGEMIGVTADEMMACGDSPNDLAMMKVAGTGIAMGNARDVVKENADMVTGTNDENGVAMAVKKLVFGQ